MLLLLVEDNPVESKWVELALRRICDVTYHIDVASTLAGAAEKIINKTYDIILLDLNLPDSASMRNTFDVIQAACEDTPIVIFTGHRDEALGLELVAKGAQDFLIKSDMGDGLQALSRKLRYALERTRHLTELKKYIAKLQAVGASFDSSIEVSE